MSCCYGSSQYINCIWPLCQKRAFVWYDRQQKTWKAWTHSNPPSGFMLGRGFFLRKLKT